MSTIEGKNDCWIDYYTASYNKILKDICDSQKHYLRLKFYNATFHTTLFAVCSGDEMMSEGIFNIVHSSTFTADLLTDVLDYLCKGKVGRWFSNGGSRGEIILRLSEFYEAEDLIALLKEIEHLKTPLSYTRWMKFIDNFEDYRHQPAKWWVSVV